MKARTPRQRKTRAYRSPLREERSVQTRDRILDGLVKVMANNGIAANENPRNALPTSPIKILAGCQL